MFEDLQERIERDENAVNPPRDRWIRNVIVLVVSLVLFGALYLVIRFVEA